MDALNLPKADLRISMTEEVSYVFDVLRKKEVLLTPEEWVRQHFVHYAINHLNFPKSLIKVESGHKFNKMARRTDIILFGNEGKPAILIECKASKETIGQEALNQAIRYNSIIKSPYVVVTNGVKSYCCRYIEADQNYEFVHSIPDYSQFVS